MNNKHFQVLIAGGGITGSSLAYVLDHYTDTTSIALLEKNAGLGEVSTSGLRNSQTLHFGDIETNYNLEKAKKVKSGASMVAKYLEKLSTNDGLFLHTHSMILGVGEKEVKTLEKRYEDFKTLYPHLKALTSMEIAEVEPQVMKGRSKTTPVLALYSDKAYAVNYQKLAQNFVSNCDKNKLQTFFNTKIKSITKTEVGYEVKTENEIFTADVVVVALGSYSLLYAKGLGYGHEYAILPVIGDYYTSTQKLLNGKVYTVQNEKLPFAAIHGDPNIFNTEETRFGPTAFTLPILERNSLNTIPDFFRSAGLDWSAFLSILKIHSDIDILMFIIKNLIFSLPLIGKLSFLKTISKIIPSIKSSDLQTKRDQGGIRPQLVNKKERRLLMGAAEIIGDKIIFNITPSPGATSCLQNAETMTKQISSFLPEKIHFNVEKFNSDLKD